MAWWVVPLIAAGVAAAGTAATSAASNAATGNQRRIKALRTARATDEFVTDEGRAMAEAGLQQQRKGITALADQQRKIMAMQGATSGADVRAVQDATNAALADLGERTSDQLRAARATEAQELEDRLALRRQRTTKTIQSSIGAGAAAFGAASEIQGMSSKQTKGEEAPDFSAVGDAAPNFEAAYANAKKAFEAGEIDEAEYKRVQDMLERYFDTSPDAGLGEAEKVEE